MPRLLLSILLFLASLFTVLPIPARQVWYLAIAVAEFPWLWMLAALLLIVWVISRRRYRLPALLLSGVALALFSRPLIGAYRVASDLDGRLAAAFGQQDYRFEGVHRERPFSPTQMIAGIGASKVPFSVHQYAPGGAEHTLRFYPSQVAGTRPCLVVVHGGSWRSGDNGELPDVNSYYAKAGYGVASINYRLAPQHRWPAPVEDVQAAFAWLRAHAAELNIDTAAFVLMGRSAGGHIVLAAAYTLHEPGLRGVVSFYGPTDMPFAWRDQHNKLVMDHQKVLSDFLGGSPESAPQQYANASPAYHVTAQSVPTLLVHGGLDQHVHLKESEILAEKLAAAGVPHLLLKLPWATHGCEYTLNGPSGQLAVYAGERFLWTVTRGSLRGR